MKVAEMRLKLQQELKKERFEHSLRVYVTALALAEQYGLPVEKVGVAALLHDCGRRIPTAESVAKCEELGIGIDGVERHQPILLHQKLGKYYARAEYGVEDEEILDAIGRHTTGGVGMGKIAQAVYLADLIEPGRNFPGVDALRQATQRSLEAGMRCSYANTVAFLMQTGLLVHPDCIAGYNELVMNGG